jgi:OOP family OmpA-OmpF porin
MKPVTRWVVLVLVVVAIAVAWMLWNRSDQKATLETGVAEQPAAPQPAVPITPKVEPVTASVLFDFDRSVLRAEEAAKLDELIAKFKSGGFDRVEAIGHADRIGSEQYNQRLSERRVEAVRAYLAGKGVDSASIRTEAMGENEAVTGETCKNMGAERSRNRKLIECLQPDRRVAITLAPRS